MAKNINEIIKRLLDISKNVINEFATLAYLSYHDKENTKEFDICINKVANLLNTEAIILNNLSLNELYEIFKIIPNYDDDTLTYERTYISIDDRIEELQSNEVDTEIDETPLVEPEEIPVIDEIPEDVFNLQSYFLDDEENEKYDTVFANYINIFSLKRIQDRIINTYSDNESDNKYKEKLLNHLKIFKYLVLSQNPKMERIGIKYRFNIAKIPYLEVPDIDTSTIAYNHCVAIIEKMYNPLETKDNVDDTTIELFNMMCFESYLNHVDLDELHRLTDLCDNLRVRAKNKFYGDIAKSKILSKK